MKSSRTWHFQDSKIYMLLTWVGLYPRSRGQFNLTCSVDTIDVSNLNRQFLFRHSDVGKSKAEVAAKFVMERVSGVIITPHNCKIQDMDDDFYSQFGMVVCGLDSIEARRWINAQLVEMAEETGEVKPLIDGGTEGIDHLRW